MVTDIAFTLNGQPVSMPVNRLKRLVDFLRDDLHLTGTKEGCGEGECGACAVLVDQELVNACLLPVGYIEGRTLITIEGFKDTPRFKILKDAFDKAGSVQCGFCTPGMLMAAEALLIHNPRPTDREVRQAMSGNLCRCTGYSMIVEAVQTASREGEGLW